MIEYFVLILILFAFILACYEDIKKREVYDYLNFSLAFIILIVAIVHSFVISSYDPIKYVSFGMTIGFAFGAMLFYFGIWGGGDSKFILGFSGASYYLMSFVLQIENTGFVYNYFVDLLSLGISLFLDTFLTYILFLDGLFILFLLVRFLSIKNRNEGQNLLYLFIVLFLLFLGLYFKYDSLTLVLIGFIVFILIFFAREGSFSSVFIKYKKDYMDLKSGDVIDSDLIFNKKKLVDVDESGYKVLSNEQVHEIRENVKEEGEGFIDVRKIFPYSILIGLNFVVYLFKIVTIESLAKTNLGILSFMLKFLFYSFMAGGVIAVFLVLYLFIKNFKKVELSFNKLEKFASFPLFFLILFLIGFFGIKFSWFLILFPIYLFVKIAKAVESFVFVSQKPLDKIVLGDWIVQDIKIKDKLYYQISDFKIGIDEFQLAKIKELAKHNKELTKLYVKDGIAFLPALFIGFILMFIF